jgi:arsenate reductase
VERKPIVLFLCTGNSARSQMAEGLLRAKAGGVYDARSAGTEPAEAIHPLAVTAMAEIGIDLAGQRPKSVREFLGHAPVRHLIIVCGGANERCPSTFPGVITRDFWPIDDPASLAGTGADALQGFRAARDEIAGRLDGWLRDHAPKS